VKLVELQDEEVCFVEEKRKIADLGTSGDAKRRYFSALGGAIPPRRPLNEGRREDGEKRFA